ncbi:MAG: adenosylcobinamide-GDP ribazoletransferase [Devosia sp.]
MSDEQPVRARQDNVKRVATPEPPRERSFGDDVVMGLRFFSRLPAGDSPFEAPDLNRIAPALPFVSVIIGIGPALLLMLLCWATVPPYFAAALAVGAMIALTGAMADDALADSADGLAGGATIERRLEIMKDSRHGTYGVAALGLYLLLRVTGLGAVAAVNPVAAAGIWLAASLVGRSGSLWLSAALPNAREGGASAAAGRVSRRAFGIGAGFAVLLALVLAAPFTSFVALVLALVVAGLVAWGWVWTCRRLIGGQSGDLIGALGALIEVAVLTVLLIFA